MKQAGKDREQCADEGEYGQAPELRMGVTWETPCGVEEPAGATWALTPSETGVLRWQAITQRLWQGFQQTPVLSGPSPHTSPLTHMLEPYTTMYVSTAIRVIADYIHNCLTQVGQTCINPQLGFSYIWSERRLFRMLTSYKSCPIVEFISFYR